MESQPTSLPSDHLDGPVLLDGPVGVVGGGAVGGWLATLMQCDGWPVTLLRRPGFCEDRGVSHWSITENSELKITAEIPCEETDAAGEPFRWLFLAVKAGDLPAVSKQICQRINSRTCLVFLGNGLGLTQSFEDCGSDRFLAASITYGLFRSKSGEISVRGDGGEITIGPLGNFAEGPDLSLRLTAALSRIGLEAFTVEDGDRVVWQKSILSAGLNPVCALLGIENGQLPSSPGFALAKAASHEAYKVAVAEGFDLPALEVGSSLAELCEKTATNRCSMLQDLDSGFGTEVEWISGAIVRRGQECGIPTPANQLLHNLLEEISSGSPVKAIAN